VFRARDTKLGRDVALKVMPAEFARDHERVARFRREAQILASLNHPHIAGIHGLEEDPATGVIALAMEFVDGEDLAARLKRGPIPVDDAIPIARQIAEALEDAHEHGVIHRDLKPANVKVTPDGAVKVLDFGLAKALEGDATGSGSGQLSHSPTLTHQGTAAGVILGTAAYMSPEQARGRKVDKRADVWSFGVVLFEMLAGRQLFAGETVSDTLAAVLRDDVDWGRLPASTPGELARLLRRCLDRDPKTRLRDIGEARLVLGRADLVSERPPGPAAPDRASVSRRDAMRLSLVGATGFLAGAGVGTWWTRRGIGSEVVEQLTFRPLTASGNVISATISPDGKLLAFVESDQGLQSLWLQQIDSGQTLRLIPDRGVTYWSHTFTPDGNSIVFGEKRADDPKGALYTISTLGGTPRRLVADIDSAPAFSPDGRFMAFTRLGTADFSRSDADEGDRGGVESSHLVIASSDGANPRVLATFRRPETVAGIFFGGPCWSPDGKSVVTAVQRPGTSNAEARAWLVSVSVDDGRVTTLVDPGWLLLAQSAFLPDGRSLLAIARSPEQTEAHLWKVLLPSGEAVRITKDLNDHRIVSLSRDGRRLVSVSGDVSGSVSGGSLRDGGSRLRRLGRTRLDGLGGVSLGGGDECVYTSNVGAVMSLWAAKPDGSDRRRIFAGGPGEGIRTPAASRSGDVYFTLRNAQGSHLTRLRAGGQSPERLGDCIPGLDVARNGGFVVYARGTPTGPRLFRRDTETGVEKMLLDRTALWPGIDVEGRRVAFYVMSAAGAFHFGVCSTEGGPLLLDIPAEPVSNAFSRLVLRGDTLYAATMPGDRANVWAIPLRPPHTPRRVTSYPDQILFDFAIGDDGAALFVARGPRVRDAQLITGF
jgi:Tol biopolymer transport system component